MDRAGLAQLGFVLGPSLGGATQGAWAAKSPEGRPVVLKWSEDPAMALRYAGLQRVLETLRGRGVPVPSLLQTLPFDGGILTVQSVVPGRSLNVLPRAVVQDIVASVRRQNGIAMPPSCQAWHDFVRETLTGGGARSKPAPDSGTAAVLDRARAVTVSGSATDFPEAGVVHMDLHTDNILVSGGRLTGILDWDGARSGDPRYDLVQLAFDLDGHGQDAWWIVETLDLQRDVLCAYAAMLVLKCTVAAIRDRPYDLARQRQRAKRVLDRVGA